MNYLGVGMLIVGGVGVLGELNITDSLGCTKNKENISSNKYYGFICGIIFTTGAMLTLREN